ncbi:TPA: acyl carrier protein [Pseudomonas putida]|nr:acyl carrier protein [Pseudomonas putida]
MLDDPGVGFEVESQVIKVLSDYFPARRGSIGVESRLVEDLCVDSISLVEVVMALNEMFAIELPDAGVGEWRTVRDVCILVECANGSNKTS